MAIQFMENIYFGYYEAIVWIPYHSHSHVNICSLGAHYSPLWCGILKLLKLSWGTFGPKRRFEIWGIPNIPRKLWNTPSERQVTGSCKLASPSTTTASLLAVMEWNVEFIYTLLVKTRLREPLWEVRHSSYIKIILKWALWLTISWELRTLSWKHHTPNHTVHRLACLLQVVVITIIFF